MELGDWRGGKYVEVNGIRGVYSEYMKNILILLIDYNLYINSFLIPMPKYPRKST